MSGSPNLVIAKYNADAEYNKVEGVDVGRFPTLAFYPKNDKKGFLYTGKRDVESFAAWLI
jgi:hypothetical protein